MSMSIQHSFLSVQAPVKDAMKIGLRSTAALAQLACEAGGRLSTLKIGALRIVVNNYSQATRQMLTGEPATGTDATVAVMQHTMNYWRSLAGLMAATQAEVAELMDSTMQEMAELAESRSRNGNSTELENLSMVLYMAAGERMLTSAQIMCKQFGESARQFAVNGGCESGLGMDMDSETLKAGHGQARTHRKAA